MKKQKITTMPLALPSGIELEIRIKGQEDVICAQRKARLLAQEIGFQSQDQWAIATAVSEAATNILKFAVCGEIGFNRIDLPYLGLEFTALDRGPGIKDLEHDLEDGFSEGKFIKDLNQPYKAKGRGCGLPAIARIMDFLSLENRAEGGLRLTSRKYLKSEANAGT